MRKRLAASYLEPPPQQPAARPHASGAARAMTVGELSRKITRLLEGEIGSVRVEGEISNLRRPSSGHLYFLLKDAEAALNAVCFRSVAAGLRVALADGKKIEVGGRVTAYTARSEYQIIITSVREAGLGDLMRRFLELRDKLKEEGLFEAARKKSLPRLPRTIGIVTSATGAALRDMLNILSRRAGGLSIIVSPCAVQGDSAPGEIVRALARLVRHGESEVIIAGRGGGSIEDLWAFNDERVVRAIAGCAVPVVSAVGHETDTTLSDYAADLRAPTPSAAAELVTAHYQETATLLANLSRSMDRALVRSLESKRHALSAAANSWGMRGPIERLASALQRLDGLAERLDRAPLRLLERARSGWLEKSARLARAAPLARIQRARSLLDHLETRMAGVRPDLRWLPRLERTRIETTQWEARLVQAARRRLRESALGIEALSGRLASVGPDSVLRRGFSIVSTVQGNRIVTRPDQVRAGQTLRVQSAGGAWRAAALPPGDELFDKAGS